MAYPRFPRLLNVRCRLLAVGECPDVVRCPAVRVPEGNGSPAEANPVLMCDLALALIPSLDTKAVTLLYRGIRPLVSTDSDAKLQKRSYKVWLCIS